VGNSSEDKAEEKDDGWDDGLAGDHCRKSKELSSESLGLKQETGKWETTVETRQRRKRMVGTMDWPKAIAGNSRNSVRRASA
jgi:hypothetical protein